MNTVAYNKMILFVVILVSFINPFTSSALTTALPAIGATYEASEAALSWVIEAFLLVSVVTIMPMGNLADRFGKRHIFLGGIALYFLSSLSVCFISSMTGLLCVRIVQGIASACIFATNMAIVSLVSPKEQRGMAMGLTIAAVYSGLTVGPVLGGFFSYYLGWQSIFYFIALTCAIDLVIGLYYMKDEWKVPVKKVNPMDYLIYAISMVAMVFGLSEITTLSVAKYLLLGGLCIFILFLYNEWHQETPLLPVHIFTSNRVFSCSSLASMLNYCATFGISFLLSIYLQRVLGMNARDAGLFLLIQPVLMAILSPFAGRWSDRINPAYLASSGMLLVAIGLGIFSYTVSHASLAFIVIASLIVGAGLSLFSAPNNNAIMGSVSPKEYSTASSVIGTVRLIGQVLSTAIITLLLSQGTETSLTLLTRHIQDAFLIFTILCLIGIVPSSVRGKSKQS